MTAQKKKYWLVSLTLILLLKIGEVQPGPMAEPKSFTEDPYVDDEKFREKVTKHEVVAVAGEKTAIPCDCTPTSSHPEDKPVLILWYKDSGKLPIYSFDLRSSSGQHWKDTNTLGERGYVYFEESPRTGAYSGSSFTGKVWKSSLNIDPVDVSDAGRYRCRVDFDISPTRNTRIKLKLVVRPTRPVIYSDDGKELDQRTMPVPEGSDLKLYCKTSNGDPMPSLSWRKASMPLTPDGLDTDATRGRVISTLVLRRLTRADQGSLVSCTAMNSDLIPALTTSVRIDILFPPVRASIVREWNFFTAGLSYNLSCQVLGSRPAPLTQVWLGMRALPALQTTASIDGNVSTTTVLLQPDKEDDGKFLSCQAKNELIQNSAIEDQWKISVHYQPEVQLSRDREDRVIREGEDLSLKCSVIANPLYHTITWRKQGVDVAEINDRRLHVLDETLYISGITGQQEGLYTCEATNQAGTGVSNRLSVRVATVPSCLTNITTVVEVSLHEEQDVHCTMKWDGDLGFRWVMVARDLGQTVDFASSQFDQEGSSSTLRFSPRSSADYGDLACMAVGQEGQSGEPCNYSIRPKGIPPVLLSSCTTYNETTTSFTVTCVLRPEAVSMSQSLAYQFEVRDAHTQRRIRNVTTTLPSIHIKSLPQSSDFLVYIYSISKSGRSEPIRLEGFTTRSGEKQLATKPELESRNPLKLIPILGALILISLVLVLITIGVVAVVRRRIVGSTHASPSSQLELLDNQKCSEDMQDYSPDVIPKDPGPGYAYGQSVEDLRYTSVEPSKIADTRLLAKENTFNTSFGGSGAERPKVQAAEVSYSELVFSGPVSSPSQSSLPRKAGDSSYRGTEYALIMPERTRAPSRAPGYTGDDMLHSPCSSLSQDAPSCPPLETKLLNSSQQKSQFYTLPSPLVHAQSPINSGAPCVSGSLKRVKFVDQNTVTHVTQSLPRSKKDKLHLCPMHKHKLTGSTNNTLETVAEVAGTEKLGDEEEGKQDWCENKVPTKSYKDIEFNL